MCEGRVYSIHSTPAHQTTRTFNMAPPDRNGLHASFILRTTDTDVFVFLKKRKAADSPSFWLSNSTRPVAVQDDGQYGTWHYAQSHADIKFVTFSTLQVNNTVCAVQYQLSPRCSWSSTYQPRIVHSVTMPSAEALARACPWGAYADVPLPDGKQCLE